MIQLSNESRTTRRNEGPSGAVLPKHAAMHHQSRQSGRPLNLVGRILQCLTLFEALVWRLRFAVHAQSSGSWTSVSFVSYGVMGGVRSVQRIRENVVELQLAPVKSSVHVPAPTLK
ncbi:hypothetical protein SAMN05443248_7644 [Bradyrhizobium erythrophlei]|jgi:hypothetical protein|uniref:Uncharacterized protein n=1 Tax=Bradyrhizobium erythrophlei TaxID=1437360 RepID=A0A1M5XV24_9BRAD|nr:hypothetical protein SAMN05443248_7644 [Bradyrhizobium erythrophlei]